MDGFLCLWQKKKYSKTRKQNRNIPFNQSLFFMASGANVCSIKKIQDSFEQVSTRWQWYIFHCTKAEDNQVSSYKIIFSLKKRFFQ